MPSKYVVRTFAENSIYHAFNRGVEKRKIFEDEQDFNIFNYYLSVYLTPLEIIKTKYPELPIRLQIKNLSDQLELIAYCLMPNHFHLLIKQTKKDAISRFMKQLTNAYTEYFNKKYERDGGLVQGRFKAILVDSDLLLLHVLRYIHLNPIVAGLVNSLKDYPWSSYNEYIDRAKNSLCSKEMALSHFSSITDFQHFIEDQIDYAKKIETIKHHAIDPD